MLSGYSSETEGVYQTFILVSVLEAEDSCSSHLKQKCFKMSKFTIDTRIALEKKVGVTAKEGIFRVFIRLSIDLQKWGEFE